MLSEWSFLVEETEPSKALQEGLEGGRFEEIRPYAERIMLAQQPPQWHPEGDAWVHTMMTLDAAAAIVRREGLSGEVALHVMLGALCHDFGKGELGITKYINGQWSSRGHEEAGPKPTRAFLEAVGVEEGLIQVVIGMVIGHFRPVALYKECVFSKIKHRPDVFLKYEQDISPAFPGEVLYVVEADQRGSAAPLNRTVFEGEIFLPREWLLVKISESKNTAGEM